MYPVLTIIIVILSVLLTLVVLVQNSKGGGLASGFSSGNQVLGVRKTTETIEKLTWGFAGAIVALSIFASLSISRTNANAAEQSQVATDIAKELQIDQNHINPAGQPAAQQAPAEQPAQ